MFLGNTLYAFSTSPSCDKIYMRNLMKVTLPELPKGKEFEEYFFLSS